MWSGQAPVCFPICGGLREDGVAQTRSGKQIKLGRHGFARKQSGSSPSRARTPSRSSSRASRIPSCSSGSRSRSRWSPAMRSTALKNRRVSYEAHQRAATRTCPSSSAATRLRLPAFDEGEGLLRLRAALRCRRGRDPCAPPSRPHRPHRRGEQERQPHGRSHAAAHPRASSTSPRRDLRHVPNSRTVDLVKKGEEKGLRVSFPDFPYLHHLEQARGRLRRHRAVGRPVHLLRDEGDVFGGQARLSDREARRDRRQSAPSRSRLL
ncbi:MAG: hypothetical protein ACLTSX_06260 [Collinsella sp.]